MTLQTVRTRDGRGLVFRSLRLTVVDGPDEGTTVESTVPLVRIGSHRSNDLVLTDPRVSRRHAELLARPEGLRLRDLDSTNGTWLGAAKVDEATLGGRRQDFRVGHTTVRLELIDETVAIEPGDEDRLGEMVGRSEPMRTLFATIEKVAPTDLSVLVTGETGTGKELVCRALHARSPRADGPLVVFDCGAVAPTLVESELFGHVKGAYTGAESERAGVFEQADGGTLFLDELGELPLDLQPKLLRALERREVRRVGGKRRRKVDVRVVAATHRDLQEQVAEGTFREDLYYRLAVVELATPPLRDRPDDLGLLVEHLLATAPLEHRVEGIEPDVLDVLRAYPWPGNVRELRNLVLRAIPFTTGRTLTLEAIPAALRTASEEAAHAEEAPDVTLPGANRTWREARDQVVAALEVAYLDDLMTRADGDLTAAARIAQLDRRTVRRMLDKHDMLERIA